MIHRTDIGQASCLICAPSSTGVPDLLLNQPNDRARSEGFFKKTERVDFMHLFVVLEPAGHYCGH